MRKAFQHFSTVFELLGGQTVTFGNSKPSIGWVEMVFNIRESFRTLSRCHGRLNPWGPWRPLLGQDGVGGLLLVGGVLFTWPQNGNIEYLCRKLFGAISQKYKFSQEMFRSINWRKKSGTNIKIIFFNLSVFFVVGFRWLCDPLTKCPIWDKNSPLYPWLKGHG